MQTEHEGRTGPEDLSAGGGRGARARGRDRQGQAMADNHGFQYLARPPSRMFDAKGAALVGDGEHTGRQA